MSLKKDSHLGNNSPNIRQLYDLAKERGIGLKTLMVLQEQEKAIKINPYNANSFFVIATLWFDEHEYQKAKDNLSVALKLHPFHTSALRLKSCILSTCDDPAYRDGKEALWIAMHAMEIDRSVNKFDRCWLHRLYLRLQAAAYAEMSDFDSAVRYMGMVSRMAITKSSKTKAEKELLLYSNNQPCRHCLD